jgi:hypothetical protein
LLVTNQNQPKFPQHPRLARFGYPAHFDLQDEVVSRSYLILLFIHCLHVTSDDQAV